MMRRDVNPKRMRLVIPMGSAVQWPRESSFSHGLIIRNRERIATKSIKIDGNKVILYFDFNLNSHRLKPKRVMAAMS